MADDTVQIPIEVIDKATAELDKIKASMSGVEQSTKTAGEEGGKLNSTFDSMAVKVAQYVTAAAAISTVVGVLKDSVAAAEESEEAQIRLESRVQRTGISWDANKDAINRAIDSASRYALVSDEEVSGALSRLITVTGSVQQSVDNLKLTMDLAKDTGMSFESAALAIGKALEGETMMLERQMPQLKAAIDALGNNATAADKAAAAIKFLNDNIGGTATQMGELTKASKTLSLEWDAMKEQIGGVIVPALAKMLGNLNDIIDTMKNATWTTWFDLISGNWAGLTNAVNEHKAKVDEVSTAQEKLNTVIDTTSSKVDDLTKKEFEWKWPDEAKKDVDKLNTSLSATETALKELEASAEAIYKITQPDGTTLYTNIPTDTSGSGSATNTSGSGSNTDVYEGSFDDIYEGSFDDVYEGSFDGMETGYYGDSDIATGSYSDIATGSYSDIATGSYADIATGSYSSAFASGGIVTEPTVALIGEAGPEAVVPLTGKSTLPGTTNVSINMSGPILGSQQQAKEFAIAVDQELAKLKIRNQSLAFQV